MAQQPQQGHAPSALEQAHIAAQKQQYQLQPGGGNTHSFSPAQPFTGPNFQHAQPADPTGGAAVGGFPQGNPGDALGQAAGIMAQGGTGGALGNAAYQQMQSHPQVQQILGQIGQFLSMIGHPIADAYNQHHNDTFGGAQPGFSAPGIQTQGVHPQTYTGLPQQG